MADFIAKHFMGEELCIYCEEEVEMLLFAEIWVPNKEYLCGTVKAVEEGVLELYIPENGTIYLNCEFIKKIWQPPFNWSKAVKAHLTGKPVRQR